MEECQEEYVKKRQREERGGKIKFSCGGTCDLYEIAPDVQGEKGKRKERKELPFLTLTEIIIFNIIIIIVILYYQEDLKSKKPFQKNLL